MNQEITPTPSPATDPKTYTIIIYILMTLGLFTGVFGLVAVIMAYIKKEDFKGTVYYDHMVYLIKTFWAGLTAAIVGIILMIILIGWIIFIAAYIWFIYRITLGFINLLDGKPVSTTSWF